MAIDFSSEIDALKLAIASGATEVAYDGKRVQYDSFEKLLARLSWLEAQSAQAAGAPITRPVASFASFSRDDD